MKRYKIGDIVRFTEDAKKELFIKTTKSFTIKEIVGEDDYGRDLISLDKAIITKNGNKLSKTFSSYWIEIDEKHYRLKKLNRIIQDEN